MNYVNKSKTFKTSNSGVKSLFIVDKSIEKTNCSINSKYNTRLYDSVNNNFALYPI